MNKRFFRRSWLLLVAVALPVTCAFAQDELKLKGTYQIEKGERRGWLILNVEVPEGFHIYSLTQKGTPPPTRLKLAESEDFRVLKKFSASKKPHVVEKDPVFGQRVESHEGKVAFMAPIEVAGHADLGDVEFDLKFHGQVCNESACQPVFNKPVKVEFAGFYEEDKKEKKK